MASSHQITVSIGVLLLLVIDESWCCQDRQGCRIQSGVCLCGIGCEYRYSDQLECRKALKGRRSDVCQRGPCNNGGSCIHSVSQDSGFKCRCEGTGFYGQRCEKACPRPGMNKVENFPYECIVI